MKIKKLIKILKQYNKNRKVKIHTSSCIENILKVDQSYDADYDEIYLTGDLDYDVGLQHSVSQTNQIFKLEKKVSQLLEENGRLKADKEHYNCVRRDVYEMLFDKCERLEQRIKSFYDSQVPSSVPTATFNYIPNNKEGQKLVDDMKQYLNKERYTLRDRGQCIDRERYSLDEVSTDRGIDKKEYGKFIKVHINEKRRK